MIIFPAIDLYGGNVVRLYKGNYACMTVYSHNPREVALDFKNQGATHIHIVDLEGARNGTTPNIEIIESIISTSGLFAEIGGGIRSLDTVEKYLSIGAKRVILGTAAVKDEEFLLSAVKDYGDRIAVGVDIKDGRVAVHGWLEKTDLDCFSFCKSLQSIGVHTIICTDISRDGAMRGTNIALYREISQQFNMKLIASGGVSTIEDVKKLKQMNIYGAIIGKAYYTGAVSIKQACEEAK